MHLRPRLAESGAEHWELGTLCRGEEVDVWLFNLGKEVFCHATMKRPLHWVNLAQGESIRNGIVDIGDIDRLKGDTVVPWQQGEFPHEEA